MEKVLRWWGLPAYFIDSLPAWKAWLEDVRYRKSLKHVLEGVFFVTWWAIWKFRNQTLFGCVLPPKGLIFDEIVANTYVWCSNRLDNRLDWRMWHQNPSFSMSFQMTTIIGFENARTNVDYLFHFAADQFFVALALPSAQHILSVRKGLHQIGANIQDFNCPFCSNEVETILHIFLKCERAQLSWMQLGLTNADKEWE
ncbi:hypothetical protein LXL04_007949 [Taraxacum kok-saghyz]